MIIYFEGLREGLECVFFFYLCQSGKIHFNICYIYYAFLGRFLLTLFNGRRRRPAVRHWASACFLGRHLVVLGSRYLALYMGCSKVMCLNEGREDILSLHSGSWFDLLLSYSLLYCLCFCFYFFIFYFYTFSFSPTLFTMSAYLPISGFTGLCTQPSLCNPSMVLITTHGRFK